MPAAQFDHAAYIAEAVSAPYQTKRRLPVVRAAPPVAGYVRPVQRSLFELCGDPAAIQPGIPVLAKPEPVEDPVPEETSVEETAVPQLAEYPIIIRQPKPEEFVEIHEAIAEALPPGVPTYVKRVAGVCRYRGAIIAQVVLFDDRVGMIEIYGRKGGRSYRWHHSGKTGTAFHWDEVVRSWVRIDEPEAGVDR